MLTYILFSLAMLFALGSAMMSAPSFSRAPAMDSTAVLVETQRAVTALTSIVSDGGIFVAPVGRFNDFSVPATDTVWPILGYVAGTTSPYPIPAVPGYGFVFGGKADCGSAWATGMTCTGTGQYLIVFATAANTDFKAAQAVLNKVCLRMTSTCIAGKAGPTSLARYNNVANNSAMFRISGDVAYP